MNSLTIHIVILEIIIVEAKDSISIIAIILIVVDLTVIPMQQLLLLEL